jgi:hypothetical protein
MYLGCIPRSFKCFDDPTLSSASTVEGNLSETQPLGVVVHNTTIGGNVKEIGGGRDTNCKKMPPTFPFGVFSDTRTARSAAASTSLGSNRAGSAWQCVLSSPLSEGGPLGPGPF